jgi:two-component system phosphate regulon sensor histidine kinase PhoR
MNRNKNTVTIILMSSSIALLIILQIFWIRSSYEKAFYDFRRESGMIFRTTVLALRDSIFLKNVEQLPGDSMDRIFTARTHLAGGNIRTSARVNIDTARQLGIREETASVHIFVSDSSEVVREDFVGPLSSKIQNIQYERRPGMKKSFIIRLGPDTLRIDTLSHLYAQALSVADIKIPFSIRRLTPTDPIRHSAFPARILDAEPPADAGSPNPRIFSDTLRCEPVPINPVHRYQASLTGVRALLFREISPQILFALFLTLVTTASFVFMYRNIRAQQRLMASKNEFISNVTHELKTPVATVSVALEALKNFSAIQNPKLTQEYLDIALRELDRLSVMTDKILDTSIHESRGVEFEPEEVDLDQTIRQMMTSMKIVFDRRKATVGYTTSGGDFKLMGSTLHLTNVLYNLVDNALKYCGETPAIDIQITDDGRKVLLSITDNGAGIAPAYQRKIFEKFFRVPSGDVHNIKGYGLGLSYVASVVKSHRGMIDIKSQPGKGSTFTITLPRVPRKMFRTGVRIPLDRSTQ